MSWLAILEIVVRLLPLLAAVLREFLDAAAAEMDRGPSKDPAAFRDDVSAWFAKARGKTWRPWRRRALARVERVVLDRSEEIRRSLVGGGRFIPQVTTGELAELRAVGAVA